MSDERQEEMADISAELRDLSVSVTHVEPQPTVFGRPISDYFAELADRMESAAKRECEAVESDALAVGGIVAAARTAEKSSAVGNAAAMREALTKIYDLTNALDEECAVDPVEIRDIARAALAEPPRNCDIYTTSEEADRAITEHCSKMAETGECVKSCPHREAKGGCAFGWLLSATGTKGANDGSK